MENNFLKNIELLNKTYNIHKKNNTSFSKIKSLALCVKMSKNKKTDLYGMFIPDEHLKYIYGTYLGKITQNEKDFDFKYYFDDNDNLILTERYSESKLINSIIYLYYDQKIEIIWYEGETEKIINVSIIEYNCGQFYRFLTGTFNNSIISFDEYIFEIIDNQLIMNRMGYLLNPFNYNRIIDKIHIKELIKIKNNQIQYKRLE